MTTPPWPAAGPDGPASASPPQGQEPPYPPYPQYPPYPPYPPYQQGPYQQGPYQQGPYQQGPYQQGPYQQGPYQQYEPYPAYPQSGQPFPPAAAPQPPHPQQPPHKWGFGAFLLAEATFLVMSLLVQAVAIIPYLLRDPAAAREDAPLPGPVLIAALAIPPVLAAVVGLVATKVRGNGPVIDLRLRFGWRDVGIGVGCGFLGLFLTIPVGWLWVYVVGEENANSAVGEVFDGMHMPLALAILVFLDVWLLAPICEEILYRGLFWGAMERRRWNRWVILGVSTAVFALAHFEPIRAPLLLVIGLPIGLARLLSGRLAASVIAHQINNFLPALGLMLLLLGHPLGA